MNPKICGRLIGGALGCALVLSVSAAQGVHTRAGSETAAQEKSARRAARPAAVEVRAAAYDAKRESVLEGTVLSYAETSQSAPIGAHVLVRTANGSVDVHLGPASYLRASHVSLAAGESVKFAGVSTVVNGRT